MNTNPYETPNTHTASIASHRRLLSYLLLNGGLVLLHVAVAVFPFLAPNVTITDISMNGTTTAFQYTPLILEWSFASLISTSVIVIVCNAGLFVFRVITRRRIHESSVT